MGAAVIHDLFNRAGLKPVAAPKVCIMAPKGWAGQESVDLRRRAVWDGGAASVTVDEVFIGNVLQAAQGQNTARQVMAAERT